MTTKITTAGLAQLVERTTLNRVVVGSIPTFGIHYLLFFVIIKRQFLFDASNNGNHSHDGMISKSTSSNKIRGM